MLLTDLTVEVRDKSLTRRGLIPAEDLNLSATMNFNNVGAWTLTLPREHRLSPILRTPGSGIICWGPNDVLFSGPMVTPGFTANADDPLGTLEFQGVTDDVILADAMAWPQPANPDAMTQTLAHDTRTGNVESVMHAFVNANIGPGAPLARRGLFAQKLVMGTNGNRGAKVTKSARFPYLGALLSDLGLTADLGFRVVQRGKQLSFETYQVKDRTKFVRLDLWNNTLASQELSITGPTATRIIVAGQGEEVNRAFLTATSAAAIQGETDWGRRIEYFLDQRQSDDPAEYQQAANEVLAAQGATTVSTVLTPMDDLTMRYGHDWSLGDRIATVADDGEYSAPVSQVVMSASSEGFRVGAVLGDVTRTRVGNPDADRLVSALQRISALERI